MNYKKLFFYYFSSVQAKLYSSVIFGYLRQAKLMAHIIFSYKYDSLHIRFCTFSQKSDYLKYVKASYDKPPVNVTNETSSFIKFDLNHAIKKIISPL